MNIHHKFVALFNATPGAYANTPSLNDTNLLLGFVETVTGVDVTEDSDFIDHVLTNMGFVQNEDSDLWDTAHGAMTGLVSANGRASAVDTAIQFLSTLGTDPTSDYFTPANRLIRKASGSEVASEANSTETDPEVLKSVFNTEYYEFNQIDQGVFSGSTLTFPYFLNRETPEDVSLIAITEGVDGIEQTRLMNSDVTVTLNGADFKNSIKVDGINLTSSLGSVGFGSRSGDLHQSLADIRSSQINTSGSTFDVGYADEGFSELAPLFTVRLTDSTLDSAGGDLRVGPSWSAGANGRLDLIKSVVTGIDDLDVGKLNDDQRTSNEPGNKGHLFASESTLNIVDRFDIGRKNQSFDTEVPANGTVELVSSAVTVGSGLNLGANGGQGSLVARNSQITASEVRVGYNYSASDGLDYTSSLISDGILNISQNSTLETPDLQIGVDRATEGAVNVSESILDIGNRIMIGDSWHEDWEGSTLEQGGSGTLSAISSTINMESDGSRPWYPELIVGRGDLATATATFSSSELNSLRAFSVGSDSSSSETTELGARGTLSLVDSTITYLSSSNPSGAAGYHQIGGYGGVGVVTMTNSTHTHTVNSPIAVEDSGGYYYAGFHVGRSQSSLTSGDEYDGTYIANNSTLTLRNQDTGNADLFFSVGARGSARGYAEFSNGSSLVIESNNTEAAESGISVSGRSETYGNFVIDASQVSISGSAMLNSVYIGNRGAGDMEVSNGGTLIVTTIGDGSNAGSVRVGDKAGAGTLTIDGADSVVGGDAYTTMTIGERPESQYNALPAYETDATADTYAGTTGSVTLTNGALLQFGTAGDGIADIFVGNGGSLVASDDSTVVGDI
ncbi:hypothetical protein N9W43_08760, partial [Litoricolaceae bacterium]|nr:hypothetical protein [Litorivicinaceae bacterium]